MAFSNFNYYLCVIIYTTVEKCEVCKRSFLYFERSFLSPRLHVLLTKISKNSNAVIVFEYILPDAKLNFQHRYSSPQCHMILQKSF